MIIIPRIIMSALGLEHRPTIRIDKLEPEEVISCLIQGGLSGQGAVTLDSPAGRFTFSRRENLAVKFPKNINVYSVRQGQNDLARLAEFVCSESDHLSWNDFHYHHPADYLGNDPSTLDEMCVYYQRLRRKSRVFMDEKKFVLKRFHELIYAQADDYAKQLGLPFKKLRIPNFTRSRTYPGRAIANTDCKGSIHYNRFFLFHDADTIRQVLVHELAHHVERGHSKRFSKFLEEAMLELGLIPRPCSYSSHLCMPVTGAKFPTGEFAPGYDFVKGIKGDYQNFLLDVR